MFPSPISPAKTSVLPGTLRWAPFLSDEKEGKESPKAGPSPALWNPPRGTGCACILLVSALGLERSHRWRRPSTERAYSSVWLFFDCQGLTLVSRCFQLTGARLPVAGTPLLQGRPGGGNHQAVGPAAQSSLVWWQQQEPQQGGRAESRLDAGPAWYPREVLRGERPKRVLVPFDRAKGTPSGKRPHQAGKPEPWAVRPTPPPFA